MTVQPAAKREHRSFRDRLIGAARLDAEVYEDIESDTTATAQAAIVVCLSALAAAIGQLRTDPALIAYDLLREVLGWALWSAITFVIGARLLKGTATWGELLRTIGFAQAPGLLSVLRAIHAIEPGVVYSVAVWKLFAVIVAIRQALDFDEGRWGTGKAILTAALGFLAYVALAALESLALGEPRLGR